MTVDERFVSPRFPRTSRYHPKWIIAGVSGGSNSLWLTEWLAEALDLRPGMRVLDLGCGRGASSIFLRREFGVQVWATCPGRTVSDFTETAMGTGGDSSRIPHGEPTARVVRAIVRRLDRPRAFFVPTWTAWAGLTLAEWCPPLFDWFIVRWSNRHVRQAIQHASRGRDLQQNTK